MQDAADTSPSVLIYRQWGQPSGPLVVLLHSQYGDQGELEPLAEPLAQQYCLYSVRGPRAQMSGTGRDVHGFYWYIGAALDEPESSTFEDGLYQLERLLFDLEPPDERRFTLIGHDQGGVLALTLAGIWPELVRAVVAIDAGLPKTLGEQFPQYHLDQTRVLLLASNAADPNLEHSLTSLRQHGAIAQLQGLEGHDSPGQVIAEWLEQIPG